MANNQEIIYDIGEPKITSSTGDQPEPQWVANDTMILHEFGSANEPHRIMTIL